MAILATGPSGPSRGSRFGSAAGTGLGGSFVPAFQRTTQQLEQQRTLAPIMEALQASVQGPATTPGQQLIQQLTKDPNIFGQVMENPQMAGTLMTLNQAVAPADPNALTGISGLDEINATFKQAQDAEARGEKRRAKILFGRVNDLAGIEGEVDPKLDLVHLIPAGGGAEDAIPMQLDPTGKGLQLLDGTKYETKEGDRLLESMSISGAAEGVLGNVEARNLRDAQVATTNFIATAGDALTLLQEEPGVNTLTGRAAALFGDLKAEAQTAAEIFGMKFEPSQLDPDTYDAQFDELGVNNARMRSLITSMAFQSAAAAGQRSNSVSNRDIVRFIEQVGGNAANPVAFAAVLRDEAVRTARNFETNFKARMKKEFEGDLGLEALIPQPTEDIEALSDDDLFRF